MSGVPAESIVSTLNIQNSRRFDVIGVTQNNVRVIDDYTHHPTEIKATLKTARMLNIIIFGVFNPPTRTVALLTNFAESFR